VTALEDLVRALGFEDGGQFGLLPLADEVVLLHALTGETGHLALRWVHLAHAPTLTALQTFTGMLVLAGICLVLTHRAVLRTMVARPEPDRAQSGFGGVDAD
jgi:hypothetical protein